MGARGWAYWAPYEDDVQAVVDELCRQVFEAGDYWDPFTQHGDPDPSVDATLAGARARVLDAYAAGRAQLEAMIRSHLANLEDDEAEEYRRQGWDDPRHDDELVAALLEDAEEQLQGLAEGAPPSPLGPPPTIEELIDRNAEEGTHSIIDVCVVADRPQPGAVAPLSREELVALFGTVRPTRAQVEERVDDLVELRPNWVGTYVVAYGDDRRPEAIFFAGCSGD